MKLSSLFYVNKCLKKKIIEILNELSENLKYLKIFNNENSTFQEIY